MKKENFIVVNGELIDVSQMRLKELKEVLTEWFYNRYEINLMEEDFSEFVYDLDFVERVCIEAGLDEAQIYFIKLYLGHLRYRILFEEDKEKIISFLVNHTDEAGWLDASFRRVYDSSFVESSV